MNAEIKTPLTTLNLCTLIAHEAVSLLSGDAESLDTAGQLRNALTLTAAANGLDDEVSPLLTWIDREMESARQFTATGKDAGLLLDPERLLPAPDPAAQLEVVWKLFQTAVESTCDQRHVLFEAARTITEMCGLEDVLLTTKGLAQKVLTAETLDAELEDVRKLLQTAEASSAEMIQK